MSIEMLPLLIFTTFAGLAAGAYVVDSLCGNAHATKDDPPARPWLFPLVCLVLLGVGLCGTLAHLGQPLRFLNGMANPQSMIAQEAYWSIAFGVIVLIDLVLAKTKGVSARPIRWAGGIVALGLMVVTGLAYYQSLGLPAWSGAATIPLFLLGDLALGAGLCALLDHDSLVNGNLAFANVAAEISFAVALCAFALHLVRVDADGVFLLIVAGIMGPVLASLASASIRAGRLSSRIGSIAVCILATLGVVLARCVFFAAGMA